jgi:hypothetical protein
MMSSRVTRLPAPVRGIIAEHVVISTVLDPLMSLRALAAYSSLSIRTLRGYLELPPDRALPCFRLPGGGKVLVRRSVFDRWLEQFQTRGRPRFAAALRDLGLAA